MKKLLLLMNLYALHLMAMDDKNSFALGRTIEMLHRQLLMCKQQNDSSEACKKISEQYQSTIQTWLSLEKKKKQSRKRNILLTIFPNH